MPLPSPVAPVRPVPSSRQATEPADPGPGPAGFVGRAHDLRWFALLAVGIGWGVAALVLLARPAGTGSGESPTLDPLHVLAGSAPTLAAVVLAVARGGRAALRDLAGRVFRWRVPGRWYVVVLLGWPALDYLARLLQRAVTGEPVGLVPLATVPPLDGLPWYVAPSLLVSTLLLDAGPLGEEIGLRGYVLPRLLARRPPLVAAVGLGVVWGVWRLPTLLVAGPAQPAQPDLAVAAGWLVLGTTAGSVLMTWLSLRTRGSVLVAGVLVHLMSDVAVADPWAVALVTAVVAVPAAVSLHRTGTRRSPASLPATVS